MDYGAEITLANAVMTDGQSLEQRGVDPDELLLPQPTDLEAGSDPVPAHAAQELGTMLSPVQAGTLFPYKWPQD
ncbi:MAG: hypothetical protein WCA38_05700 [Candidatus Acidiferrales bacterium]